MGVLKNARVFHDGIRLDTTLTAISSSYNADSPEETVIGDTTHVHAAGALKTLSLGYRGLWAGGAGGPEETLFNSLGQTVVITFSPNNAAVGNAAYFSEFIYSEFSPTGQVGDNFTFTGKAQGKRVPLVRGQILFNSTGITSSGTGTGVQVGAASANQSVYAALHVVTVPATAATLDVTIESAPTNAFSSPTTRFTFSQYTTTVGAEWGTPVAGAITDTYWRVNYTVGGTGPDYDFAVVLGIL